MELFRIEFLSPQAFLLVFPAVLLGLLTAFRPHRSITSATLRIAAFFLLIAALADPVTREQSSKAELIALFDSSLSISQTGKEALAKSLERFLRSKQDVRLNLLPFAREVSQSPTTLTPGSSSAEILAAVEESSEKLDKGETNLGAAISAAAQRSNGASILLLSDGFENVGDARQAARTAAARGSRLFPLIPELTAFQNQGVRISSLYAPLTVNAGDLAEIRTSVRNSLQSQQSSQLEVYLDEKKLLGRSVTIEQGEERLFTLNSPAIEDGVHRIRAVVTDSNGAKTESHRWISARSRAQLFFISGTAADKRVLNQLLAAKGYSVKDIVADGRETIPSNFENCAGVILNNVALEQLPAGFLRNLRNFVSNGGGLVIVGGDRSYGLGGFIGTELEEISPVKFVPPQTSKRRLTNAVILVIDKSRSMVFEDKIEGAKGAALTAIRSMKEEDMIGVIGFDASPFIIVRLAKVSEVRATAEDRLRRLTAAGNTDLLPALAMARQHLERSGASRKHLIVLSDGKVPLQGDAYVQEISKLRQEGISVSTVALGVEADAPFMQMLAQYGKGAFYHTLDPSRLPEIFVHDIKVTTGEKTMKEQQDFPVGIGPAGIKITSIDRYPVVRGFVQTIPKSGSNIELIIKQDSEIYPLLASWNYGAGKVVAFTSDANGRWSLPWLRWEPFPKFWTDVVENIEKSSDSDTGKVDFDLRYSVNRRSLELDLAIFDEKLRRDASPKISAEIVLPGGEVRTVGFLPQSQGRFNASLPNARPGDYRLNIQYGSIKFPPLALTASGEAFGEQEGMGINVQNLAELAFLTGGTVNPKAEQVATIGQVSEVVKHHFLPLVIAAFFLILASSIIREVGPRIFLAPLLAIRRSLNNKKRSSGIYGTKKAQRS